MNFCLIPGGLISSCFVFFLIRHPTQWAVQARARDGESDPTPKQSKATDRDCHPMSTRRNPQKESYIESCETERESGERERERARAEERAPLAHNPDERKQKRAVCFTCALSWGISLPRLGRPSAPFAMCLLKHSGPEAEEDGHSLQLFFYLRILARTVLAWLSSKLSEMIATL